MATNIINNRPTNVMQQSALLKDFQQEAMDDLGGGIQASFPVLSIKGKVWRVKFRGEETKITDDRGYPRPDVDVVIVMSPNHKSKVFFPNGFNEDSPEPPTCWASDAKVPDGTVESPQASSCAVCPQNVLGSRVTDQGKKAKACGDHKRIVVVPGADVANEAFGGPMLLRVPASSLKTLQAYGDYLKRNNALYFGCVTTMTFDPDFAHQVINFDYARALTDEEVQVVLEHRKGEQVARILNEELGAIDPTLAEAPSQEGVEEITPEVTQDPPVQPQPVKPPPAAAPRPAPHSTGSGQATAAPPRPAATVAAPSPKPAQQAPKPSVGAFASKPAAPPLRPSLSPTPTVNTVSTGGISRAVARPATPPPSARPVVQAQQELPLEDAGNIPDELDEKFSKLMGG